MPIFSNMEYERPFNAEQGAPHSMSPRAIFCHPKPFFVTPSPIFCHPEPYFLSPRALFFVAPSPIFFLSPRALFFVAPRRQPRGLLMKRHPERCEGGLAIARQDRLGCRPEPYFFCRPEPYFLSPRALFSVAPRRQPRGLQLSKRRFLATLEMTM